MNQLWFTERDIRCRWTEIEHEMRRAQKRLLERLLHVEGEEQLRASWHQRGSWASAA